MKTIEDDIQRTKEVSERYQLTGESDSWPDTMHRLAAEVERLQKPVCKWTEDEDGYWETSCGSYHTFTHGGPVANMHRHCPYCGGKLEATK